MRERERERDEKTIREQRRAKLNTTPENMCYVSVCVYIGKPIHIYQQRIHTFIDVKKKKKKKKRI